MRNPFKFLVVSIFLFSMSCTDKIDGVVFDDKLAPFLLVFEEEAAKRGVVFDNSIEMIEGRMQNIPQTGVVGACKRNEGEEDNPQIFFDNNYWDTATQLEREYVFFHEMGHCFLHLDHDDSADDKGDCISIMASGIGGCRDNYNATTRDSLLNELFSR